MDDFKVNPIFKHFAEEEIEEEVKEDEGKEEGKDGLKHPKLTPEKKGKDAEAVRRAIEAKKDEELWRKYKDMNDNIKRQHDLNVDNDPDLGL